MPDALGVARLALDRLEAMWRERMERFGHVLAGLEEGKTR